MFPPKPPAEKIPIPDLRTLGKVASTRASADVLTTLYSCQTRQEWYWSYAEENDVQRPEFIGSVTTTDPVLTIAGQIRESIGFGLPQRQSFPSGTDTERQLIDAIESLGVLVMVDEVARPNAHRLLDPAEFRGFALSDPRAPLVFVNGAATKATLVFTMLHELARLWLGRSALCDASLTTRDSQPEELWCSNVATEVLVPLAQLRHDYRGTAHPAELERLRRKYRVSTLVILRRLTDASFLSWDEYSGRYIAELERIQKLPAVIQENRTGRSHPAQVSHLFARALLSSTLEGTTPYREAYRLLGTKKHATFEKLTEQLGVA